MPTSSIIIIYAVIWGLISLSLADVISAHPYQRGPYDNRASKVFWLVWLFGVLGLLYYFNVKTDMDRDYLEQQNRRYWKRLIRSTEKIEIDSES